MTTKNLDSFVEDGNILCKKYVNLNLNQNLKYENKFMPVISKDAFKLNNLSYTKMSWRSTVLDDEFHRNKLNFRQQNVKQSSHGNDSIFTLHISTYKNSNETYFDPKDSFSKQINDAKRCNSLIKLVSTTKHQNPFEFPRQQEEQNADPDRMQFRGQQELLNPNQQYAINSSNRIPINHRLTIHQSNDSYRSIANQLGHSASGVWYSKKRSLSSASLKNVSKRLSVLQDWELMRLADEAVHPDNMFIHRKNIASQLSHSGYNLSAQQVSRIAMYDGLYITRSKLQQMISPTNKELRILYREYVMRMNQYFPNHLFVDECKIVTGHHGKKEWQRVGAPNPKRPRVSHRSGFSIFGGISRRGPTPFLVIAGTARINSEQYCNMIGNAVYPFIRDAYNMECYLIQDNASIHISQFTKDFMDALGIRRSFFPPQSPDFNGIEYVWRSLKEFVSQKNPDTLEELQSCISEFVRTKLTVEFCNKLIDQSRLNIIRSIDGRNYEGEKPTEVLYRDAH